MARRREMWTRRDWLASAPAAVAIAGAGCAATGAPAAPPSAQAGQVLWAAPMAGEADIAGWRMEGPGEVSFVDGRMRLESAAPPELGQAANFTFWMPVAFADNIRISWDFRPLREPGLAMLFFAASGQDGRFILDPGLAPRTGVYNQYIRGDIQALHLSYFRRKEPDERRFHTLNLRKTPGFYLAAQAGDPIPDAEDADAPYRISVENAGARVKVSINGLMLLDWTDPGDAMGPVLGGGGVGFRQLAPMAAEYANLRIETLN